MVKTLNLCKSSSPDPNTCKPCGVKFKQIISDERSIEIAKMMALRWRLTFYDKVKFASACVCIGPIHLNGNSLFDISSKDYDSVELKLDEKHWGRLIDTKYLKLNRSKIQDGCHSRHLENQFSTSLPKSLNDLSRNLLFSYRVTWKKWAKIVSIRNPRWSPQPPSWKSVLDIFALTTRRIVETCDVATVWRVDEK